MSFKTAEKQMVELEKEILYYFTIVRGIHIGIYLSVDS